MRFVDSVRSSIHLRSIFGGLLLASFAMTASPVEAALYRIEVTGVLTAHNTPGYEELLERHVPIGSAVLFTGTVDTSVTAAPCTLHGGVTYPALLNATLTIGAQVWTRPVGQVEVDTLTCHADYAADNLAIFFPSGLQLQTPTPDVYFNLMPLRQLYMPILGAPAAPLGRMPDPFTGSIPTIGINWGATGGPVISNVQSTITNVVPAPALGSLLLLGLTPVLRRAGRRRH